MTYVPHRTLTAEEIDRARSREIDTTGIVLPTNRVSRDFIFRSLDAWWSNLSLEERVAVHLAQPPKP